MGVSKNKDDDDVVSNCEWLSGAVHDYLNFSSDVCNCNRNRTIVSIIVIAFSNKTNPNQYFHGGTVIVIVVV